MTYRSLLATLDDWFARGVAQAAGAVPCRRGCSACCHGPFDISPADAALVAEGVSTLPPDERRALARRAEAQLSRCAELVPGWASPWDLDTLDERTVDAFTEAMASSPCPALGPAGECTIHAHRPATCRLTGLAVRSRDGSVLENHCPIQSDFPAYAALAPVDFDLQRFEELAEACDREAAALGHRSTTVAGAIVAWSRRSE